MGMSLEVSREGLKYDYYLHLMRCFCHSCLHESSADATAGCYRNRLLSFRGIMAICVLCIDYAQGSLSPEDDSQKTMCRTSLVFFVAS
jgi:hypothetical protein